MNFLLRKLLLIFFLTLVISSSYGDSHYWLTYTKQGDILNALKWNTRLGVRQYDFEQSELRWGLSPTLQLGGEKLSWMVASRFFYYDKFETENYIETRPWVGFDFKQSTALTHQVKWEHRIFNNDKSSMSRIRYRFKWNAALYSQGGKFLKLGFAPEAFWCVEEQQKANPDAIRWIVPITYKASKNWQVQLAPFLQTNGFDFNAEEYLLALRLNIKSF